MFLMLSLKCSYNLKESVAWPGSNTRWQKGPHLSRDGTLVNKSQLGICCCWGCPEVVANVVQLWPAKPLLDGQFHAWSQAFCWMGAIQKSPRLWWSMLTALSSGLRYVPEQYGGGQTVTWGEGRSRDNWLYCRYWESLPTWRPLLVLHFQFSPPLPSPLTPAFPALPITWSAP